MPLIPVPNKKPLLDIKSLSCGFENGFMVQDISLKVRAGERVALVGESGSGKSFIANMILKLYPHINLKNGNIAFEGRDLLALSERQIRKIRGKEIAYIAQEPLSSLNPLHKVGKQILESLILHCPDLSKKQRLHKLDEVLSQVGLKSELADRYPYELSGGQRQRVAIAMSIINHPKLLICDEPTTALDASIQKQIMELLENLSVQYQIAVLLISHDLGVVRGFAHRVYVAKEGKICESGEVGSVFEKPKNPYTQLLLEALKLPKKSILPSEKKVLEVKHFGIAYAQKRFFFKKNAKMIVNDVNFILQSGETLGIVGESGSGKSSLAMGILRLIESSGEEYLLGQAVSSLSNREFRPFRRDIQVVFQDPYASLNPRMRVRDIIFEALRLGGLANHSDLIGDILDSVGLERRLMGFYPYALSGGQRQRVSIARAIALKPKIIVLDEPTSALDKSMQKVVIELLLDLQEKFGLAYLFISHDLDVIEAVCDRVMVLQAGKVVESGDVKDVFTNPKNPYTQALLQARF
ncbi:dipeptide ABC transporter ATP-binding protein [Helicobacter sp. 11S02596-1]|uniref:dipeptide ABC transporter ATP-binding protein n=1 Tax=Helicobacter sp. 11S02596-1 TaxID=1476194 RepID=UPI000BA63023|nr:dipeptide ABC transporter ATP-binding protein [Helicobacter sp. 11S02596-1]